MNHQGTHAQQPKASIRRLTAMLLPLLIGLIVQVAPAVELEAGTDADRKRRDLEARIAQLEQERRKMLALNGVIENRALATVIGETIQEINGQYASAKGKVKETLDAYNKYARVAMQSRESLAAAYEAADSDRVKAGTTQAIRDEEAMRRSLEALKAREKQVEYESQKQVAAWQAASHPTADTEFKSYLNSRLETANAYRKLADAYLAACANPQDSSSDGIEDLKDNVTAAELAVALAQRKWVYAAEIGKNMETANRLMDDKIIAKIESMKEVNAKTIDAIAEQAAAVMKLRKADRARNKAAQEIEETLKSAAASQRSK